MPVDVFGYNAPMSMVFVVALVFMAAPATDPLTWPRPATTAAPTACDFTVEDCAARCAKGDQHSCYRLGRLHSTGFLAAKDDALAARLFETACASKVGDACNAVGATIRTSGDLAAAVVVFEKACALGSAKGCMNGGLLRDRWRGISDKSRARELFDRGCALDQPMTARACVELGVLRRAAGDDVGARAAWTRACTRGEPRSCTYLTTTSAPVVRPDRGALRVIAVSDCEAGDGDACGTVAAQANNDAIDAQKAGRPGDATAARQWFERGCALGAPEACMQLADRLVDGRFGYVRDLPVAAAAARVACVEGVELNMPFAARGCRQYADRLDRGEGIARDEAAAVALYIDTCERSAPFGCDEAGAALLAGRTVAVDRPRALALLNDACRRNDRPSCAILKKAGVDVGAIAAAADADRLREQRLYCEERGIAESCAWVGQRLLAQTSTRAEGVTLLQRACTAGSVNACVVLAIAPPALQIPDDVVTAARTRACSLGHQPLCETTAPKTTAPKTSAPKATAKP